MIKKMIHTGTMIALIGVHSLGIGSANAQQQETFPPLISGARSNDQQTDDTQRPRDETPDRRETGRGSSGTRDGLRDAALGVALGVILGAATAEAKGQDKKQEREREPFIIPPRTVLIKATLYAVNGKLSRARLTEVNLVNTYAPKSFSQDSGPWTVTIYGRVYSTQEMIERRDAKKGTEPVKQYRIRNPLIGIEQETAPGSAQPFTPVQYTGQYDWRLVVPLYDDGMFYDADYIRIVDNQTERVILTAPIR